MTTLKELTHSKHSEAESQPFIKSIFKKQVKEADYKDYLYQLMYMYYKLEDAADSLGIFEGIEEIKRGKLVEMDWIELSNGEPAPKLNDETKAYLDYIESIKNDKQKILAHVYVRHLGDMYGGQMLAKLLPGSNNMFKFENIEKCMMGIRKYLTLDLAEEANVAFDYNIKMVKPYNGSYN